MRICNKILSLLRQKPYSSSSFDSHSKSQKSIAVKVLHNFAQTLSNGSPGQLYCQLLFHSRIGAVLSEVQSAARATHLLNNIREMHTNVAKKYKSSVLSQVAGLYSRADLQRVGFQFSSTQYQNAMKKAKNGMLTISDYVRHVPPSRAPTSQDVVSLITNYLQSNSRLSSSTLVHSASSDSQVYYLKKPKCDVYNQLKTEHPEVKVSQSTFYKLCPKNFKKAWKMTDMCPICESGKKLERKLGQQSAAVGNTPVATTPVLTQLNDDLQQYHQHLFFKNEQQQLYKQSIDQITTSSCIVTADFKENFRIGGGPIETSQQFFEKEQVSVLGFAGFSNLIVFGCGSGRVVILEM